MALIDDSIHRRAPLQMWLALGMVLAGLAGVLAWYSPLFGYDYTLAQLPALPLAAGLMVAGLAFLTLPWLIRSSLGLVARQERALLYLILALGALMRVALLWSEPALEDDYQRYMWDGAVTAHGLNPYALSPEQATHQPAGSLYKTLAERSGVIIGRVNHPAIRTLYPPVAQGAFALAHLIAPWSLIAWRAVCLGGEAATLVLLLLLLRHAGRSPLWVALYWWNPVVIKELINSAHMEAIVTPMVLAAFWFSIRRNVLSATAALGLAMGAKLWPVMLAPLVLRGAFRRPGLLAACAALLAGMAAMWLAAPYLGGFDQSSGFVAYAQRWKTGSALFPQIEAFAAWAIGLAGWPGAASAPFAGLAARGAVAVIWGCIILWLARRPLNDARDLMTRGAVAVGALVLLVPAQFPWYFVWLAPFLCFVPSFGLLAITALIPLYYSAFHFIAIGQREVFRDIVVWYIWVPVWLLIAFELWWQATAWRRWRPGAIR